MDALQTVRGREVFAEVAEGILKNMFRLYTCKEVRKVGLGRQLILQGALEQGGPLRVS